MFTGKGYRGHPTPGPPEGSPSLAVQTETSEVSATLVLRLRSERSERGPESWDSCHGGTVAGKGKMLMSKTLRMTAAVFGLAIGTLLSGCTTIIDGRGASGTNGEPVRAQEYDLRVTFSLGAGLGLGPYDIGPGCDTSASLGLGDINTGTPIQVRDNAGTVIGSGSLGELDTSGWPVECVWSDTITVPTRQDFYVIEVGSRGEVTFTEDEIALPAFGKALAELVIR